MIFVIITHQSLIEILKNNIKLILNIYISQKNLY